MIKLLKIEFIKIQKRSVWYITLGFIILFLCLNYVFYLDFQDTFWRTISITQDANPWHFFVDNQAKRIEFCVGINILILINWLHYEEIANGMWKRNFLFPTPIYKIIFAKILLVSGIVFSLLIFLFVFTLGVLKPKLTTLYSFLFYDKYKEDPVIYVRWALFYLPVFFSMIIFQEWLTIKFRNSHLVSFFIGFLGLMLSFVKFSPYFSRFNLSNQSFESILLPFLYILLFTYFIIKELSDGDF